MPPTRHPWITKLDDLMHRMDESVEQIELSCDATGNPAPPYLLQKLKISYELVIAMVDSMLDVAWIDDRAIDICGYGEMDERPDAVEDLDDAELDVDVDAEFDMDRSNRISQCIIDANQLKNNVRDMYVTIMTAYWPEEAATVYVPDLSRPSVRDIYRVTFGMTVVV